MLGNRGLSLRGRASPRLCRLAVLAVFDLLAGCGGKSVQLDGAPAEAPATPREAGVSPSCELIDIEDPALESAIREELAYAGIELPAGAPIAPDALASLSVLAHHGYNPETKVKTLAGIECARGLRVLRVSGSELFDLSPLSGSSGLVELDLYANDIVDLTPLAGLHDLEILLLDGNAVSDLSPLAGLARLRELELGDLPAGGGVFV